MWDWGTECVLSFGFFFFSLTYYLHKIISILIQKAINITCCYLHLHIYQTLLSKATCSTFRLYIFWSVHVFPGNRTHNLCAANAMLYHWATQEHCVCRQTVNNNTAFIVLTDVLGMVNIKWSILFCSIIARSLMNELSIYYQMTCRWMSILT